MLELIFEMISKENCLEQRHLNSRKKCWKILQFSELIGSSGVAGIGFTSIIIATGQRIFLPFIPLWAVFSEKEHRRSMGTCL